MIPVVGDADSLFGTNTRGLLIHFDDQGRIRLHWSPQILDEPSRVLVDTGRKPDAESAHRHDHLMRAALPMAEIPTQQVQAQSSSAAPAMLSAPEPGRQLERLATDGQSLTAAALHDAWQQRAVRP